MQEKELLVKVVEMEEAIVGIRKDGLGHVYLKSGTELDVDLQVRLYANYLKLTGGRKYNFIFEAGEYVTITSEARQNAKHLEAASPVGAIAAVVNNLAYRLIADFYYKFNKPQKPYKVVRNFQEGIRWLKSLEHEWHSEEANRRKSEIQTN
jgi:hypothetical protein